MLGLIFGISYGYAFVLVRLQSKSYFISPLWIKYIGTALH